MDDLTALRRYHRTQDPEAFTHLVSGYQQMVFAVCQRSLSNPADAEDATQETFLKLARNAGKVRSNVAAWLYTCARSTALDTARRETTRRRHHRAAAHEPRPAPEEHPGKQSDARELIAKLDDALEQLDDADRELICRRFFTGITQAQIARADDVSQSLVSRRLRAAIGRLHAQMRRLGCGVALAALVPTLEAQAAAVTVPAGVNTALVKIGLSGAGPATVSTTSIPATGAALMALSTPTKIAAVAAAALLLAGGTAAVLKLRAPVSPITLKSEALTQQGYELDASEDIRVLSDPYPHERNDLLAQYAGSNNLNDWAVAFEWHRGADSGDDLRFKASSLFPDTNSGTRKYEHWVAQNVLDLAWYQLGDHGDLTPPYGDWIIRGDLTDQQKRTAYAEVLSRESGKPVTLVRSQETMDCVVWRGQPAAPPATPGESAVVTLSAAAPFDPAAPPRVSGHSTSPESWFAQAGLPFFDEADGPALPPVVYAIPEELSGVKPNTPQLRTAVNRVLRNLEQQLPGGTFTIEPRTVEVWTPAAAN